MECFVHVFNQFHADTFALPHGLSAGNQIEKDLQLCIKKNI